MWKKWLEEKAEPFMIGGAQIYTAREDRNMLSIGLRIITTVRLGEKEVVDFLAPLLDRLHEDGLL
jgi:hypothetical protein